MFDKNASGVEALLYRDNDTAADNLTENEPVAEFTGSETLQISKGRYILVTSESKDFAKQTSQFTLGDTPEKIIIYPLYSSNKLTSLLPTEKGAITTLLNSSFPGVIGEYDVDVGRLYEHGDWYGTTLRLRLTDEQRRLSYIDIYRIVAQRVSGEWRLVTTQPELIVNIKDYPQIPRDVLVDLNRQK